MSDLFDRINAVVLKRRKSKVDLNQLYVDVVREIEQVITNHITDLVFVPSTTKIGCFVYFKLTPNRMYFTVNLTDEYVVITRGLAATNHLNLEGAKAHLVEIFSDHLLGETS